MSSMTETNPTDFDPSSMAPEPGDEQRTPLSTWIKRAVITAIALVVLGYGAIFFYANVINDAPDALDTDDLSAALESDDADTETAEEPAADTDEAASEPVVENEAPAESADSVADAPAAGFDGTWIPTTASEFGYRVDEVLGGVNVTAVGRSNEIEGSLTIDGSTAEIEATVQVANIQSDDSRRDNAFRTQIMDTENFPTATFTTTAPIDFGAIPGPGEQITATAVGELTLKGTTLPVEFEVTAQADDDSIGVLGNIPITFTDYGIDNPSNPAVSLEDDGVVEFILVFERA